MAAAARAAHLKVPGPEAAKKSGPRERPMSTGTGTESAEQTFQRLQQAAFLKLNEPPKKTEELLDDILRVLDKRLPDEN